MYSDIDLKLLSGKNTQEVNKLNIRDSLNRVFDELNEILAFFILHAFSNL